MIILVRQKIILEPVEEFNNGTHDSEPAQYLKNNQNPSFRWFIAANVFSNKGKEKSVEAIHIALKRPKLNDQVKHDKVAVFRNDIK